MKYRILFILLFFVGAVGLASLRTYLNADIPPIMVVLYMIHGALIFECFCRARIEIREEKEDRDVLEIDENGNVVRKDRA